VPKSINDIIGDVIAAEGGYVNSPSDPGNETKYGITIATARAHGYKADMRDLPESLARAIYYEDYVVKPGFDNVLILSAQIAAELVDTGVNMGTAVAAKFLQQSLNSFNTDGSLFADLIVDGAIGNATINALAAYMRARKEKAIDVLLKALNCLQGARYIELSESNKKLCGFTFGWLDNRVKL
jgi:lysozyme family protein